MRNFNSLIPVTRRYNALTKRGQIHTRYLSSLLILFVISLSSCASDKRPITTRAASTSIYSPYVNPSAAEKLSQADAAKAEGRYDDAMRLYEDIANEPSPSQAEPGYAYQKYQTGIVFALLRIGQLYELGLGVQQDYNKAFYLYKDASDACGIPMKCIDAAAAQIKMGYFYFYGLGVPANPERAEQLLSDGESRLFGTRHLVFLISHGLMPSSYDELMHIPQSEIASRAEAAGESTEPSGENQPPQAPLHSASNDVAKNNSRATSVFVENIVGKYKIEIFCIAHPSCATPNVMKSDPIVDLASQGGSEDFVVERVEWNGPITKKHYQTIITFKIEYDDRFNLQSISLNVAEDNDPHPAAFEFADKSKNVAIDWARSKIKSRAASVIIDIINKSISIKDAVGESIKYLADNPEMLSN